MRRKKATLNIMFSLVSLVLTSVLTFIMARIFVENIGVEASGLNSVFTNVISILSMTELGIAGAINYNLYKPVHDKDYKRISLIMTFYKKCYQIIGIVILVLALVASNFVHLLTKDTTYNQTYIQIGFLICAMNTVASYFLAYHRNLLYAFQDNYISVIFDFILKVTFTIVQIWTLLEYHNYYLYLALNLMLSVSGNICATIVTRKRYKEIEFNIKENDKELEKKVMSDVKDLASIQVAAALINFTDSIIISKILGIIIAGMYSFYGQVINILTGVINTIFSSLGASLGNLLAEDNKTNSKKILDILIYFCYFLGIFFASGVAGTMFPFIRFWLGDKYIISYDVVVILALNLYIYVQRQVVTYYMRTGGYHKQLVVPLIVEAIINLGVSVVLANYIGLVGVFIGTNVSAMFGWIVNSKQLCNIFEMDYKKYVLKQGGFALVFLVQLGLTNVFIKNMNFVSGNIVEVIFSGILSVMIPIIIIVIYILKTEELRFIKEKIFR